MSYKIQYIRQLSKLWYYNYKTTMKDALSDLQFRPRSIPRQAIQSEFMFENYCLQMMLNFITQFSQEYLQDFFYLIFQLCFSINSSGFTFRYLQTITIQRVIIIKIVRYYLTHLRSYMLINKKSKGLQDKTKTKAGQTIKKPKKSKILSPNKQKVTPDTKKLKKDQNLQSSKNTYRASNQNTQSIQLIKNKEKQGSKSNILKKNQNNSYKNKLLTTSPIQAEKQKSNQKQRSHDKSKSRSFSKPNTYRSNNQRDKQFLKSVTRKLYANARQINKERSHSKSKSKSKSRLNHSGKDMTPPKQTKYTKPFNVADRQIKFKKSEEQELKKAIKKKVQNRLKGEVFLYPQNSEAIEEAPIEPTFKAKKKVPQIKTQFSQRRGSFFDENLLKRLQIGHLEQKNTQHCPFWHIKSSFQYKFQRKQQENKFLSSLSQRNYNHSTQTIEDLKAKQIQNFKKEQENKWSKMLRQLQNLKGQQKIPEKIDQLIRQLNQNYSCLQQKVSLLSLESPKVNEQQKISSSQRLNIQSNQINKLNGNIQPGAVKTQKLDFEKKDLQNKNQAKVSISEILQKQKSINDAKQQLSQTKKANTINLGNEFFDFFQNKPAQKLKRQLFEEDKQPSIDPNMQKDLEQIDQSKISDSNLLKQLDLFDKPSALVEVLSLRREDKSQFETQMEQIRQAQNEYFNKIPINQDFSPNIDQEIKVYDDISSQSMLLKNIQQFSANPHAQVIANEVQHTLILQFCSNILRNKQVLNNFLTTYSYMVDANVINVQYADDDFKPKIESSNEYIMQILKRLLNYFQVNDQQLFMKQINIPFECKPMEILKFIRCAQEDTHSISLSSNGQNAIIMPFLGLQKIQQFQTEVLRNQYYIPNYFSFNHSIYDFFNDVFDELRPFGSKGKSIFSLQLSHGIKTFSQAARLITEKFNKSLSLRYYQQPIEQQKYSNQEGMFEIIYFTCLQVIDQIFQRQTITLFKLLSKIKA